MKELGGTTQSEEMHRHRTQSRERDTQACRVKRESHTETQSVDKEIHRHTRGEEREPYINTVKRERYKGTHQYHAIILSS